MFQHDFSRYNTQYLVRSYFWTQICSVASARRKRKTASRIQPRCQAGAQTLLAGLPDLLRHHLLHVSVRRLRGLHRDQRARGP